MPLALQFRQQLDTFTRQELDQLVASLQLMFASTGTWKAVTFDASMFTGNGAMLWGVSSTDMDAFNYAIIGKVMLISFSILTATVGGTVSTTLRLGIPEGRKANKVTHAALYYEDNGVAGAGFVRSVYNASYLELFKAGSTNWTALANSTSVRGQISIDLI